MEIVAKCKKCGREFVSLPDHVKTDAYGRIEQDINSHGIPFGPKRMVICGGRIVRLPEATRETRKDL